ncbi:MAG: metallophosphoesterase family protein [Oscillospiraceae bacterium]
MLVFSDSHGRTLGMVRAVRQQQPDAVFHLGDCERDTQRLEKEFPDLPLYRVCGNCDREPVNPEVLQCTLDGVKFFCTHGAPLRREVYARRAAQRGLLRRGGHRALRPHAPRHAQRDRCRDSYVVNPGTAGVGAMCTYACIETRDGAIRSAGIHAIPEA